MEAADPVDPRAGIDDIVAQLQARVEQRRRRGDYPEDLEVRLQEHQRRIAEFRAAPELDRLRAALGRVDEVAGFSAARIESESTRPGGKAVHDVVAKLTARQTAGVLEQVQQFADAVRDALRALLAVAEEPAHVHGDLLGQIDVLLDRLAAFERGPVDSAAALGDLRARVEALEAAESRRRFRAPYSSAAFEEAFRGSREELLDRYRDLAARLRDCAPVLDIGFGRGEFLDLLAAEGVAARGVEMDAALVEAAAARGLDVKAGDGLAELAAADDGSLGGVVLIQVVEHLSAQQVVDLVLLAKEKVRPGGRVVVETINPQSLSVFARSFFIDPTHTRPVHPAYLAFVFREAGFADVEIEWRSPEPGAQAEDRDSRLHQLVFGPQDYALIATA